VGERVTQKTSKRKRGVPINTHAPNVDGAELGSSDRRGKKKKFEAIGQQPSITPERNKHSKMKNQKKRRKNKTSLE